MKSGELWILELPFREGREQRGVRPCLILADTKTDMIITVPLTSNLQASRFPNTLRIESSKENGLEKNSIALIFHIQSLDKKRFIKKIGDLEDSYFSEIKKAVRELVENQ